MEDTDSDSDCELGSPSSASRRSVLKHLLLLKIMYRFTIHFFRLYSDMRLEGNDAGSMKK